MEEELTYHSKRCQGLTVDQTTGYVSFDSNERYADVAQLISTRPISIECDTFSLSYLIRLVHDEVSRTNQNWFQGVSTSKGGISRDVIYLEQIKSTVNLNTSEAYNYTDGIHVEYRKNISSPGWDADSVAYHADDGGIYINQGFPGITFGPVPEGSVMECSFNFDNNTATFRRDGDHVFTSIPLSGPTGGFYPIIGLHSPGEVIQLLEVDPWMPDYEVTSDCDVIFHTLYSREVRLSQRSGIARYRCLSQNGQIGQIDIISKCPLGAETLKFSVEIVSLGEEAGISVGVCHRLYPDNCNPGGLPNSIAYYIITEGWIYRNGECVAMVPKHRMWDVLSCELDDAAKVVVFHRNGQMVYRSEPLATLYDGLHAIVGFQSPGDAVCLLEKEPWRLQASRITSEANGASTSDSEFDDTSKSNLISCDTSKADPISDDTSKPDPISDETSNHLEAVRMPKCCICMDKGVSRFLIPCGHTFCVDCTEEWTLHHRTCPACRVRYQQINILYF